MKGFDLGFISGSLRYGQFFLKATIEATRFQFYAIRAGGSVGQTQVNAYAVLAFGWLDLHINHNIEVPAATGIFVEATRAEFILVQAVTVPHLKVVAIMVDLSIFPLSCTCIDGYPAQ